MGDAGALAELKEATFRDSYGAANRAEAVDSHVARAFSVAAVTRELEDPLSPHRWVLDAGRPVAYLKLNLGAVQSEPGLHDGVEIEQLYVQRTHHGAGVGRLLLAHAEQFGQELAAPFLWLGVWEANAAAIAFYQRNGFEAFGEHEFLFGDDLQRDLLMRRPVRPVRPAGFPSVG